MWKIFTSLSAALYDMAVHWGVSSCSSVRGYQRFW